ncbi:MAG: hypothetical protein ABJB74_14615 [Gemmatimonas sp.]
MTAATLVIRASAPLYRQLHHITSGKQTIRITVSKEPKRAEIDPRNKLIDRDRQDNVVGVVMDAGKSAPGK